MKTNDLDINVWQEVPVRVAQLLPEAAKARVAHEKAALASHILPLSAATWSPDTDTLRVYLTQLVSEKTAAAYVSAAIRPADRIVFPAPASQPDWAREILIKRASSLIPGLDKVWHYGNAMLGGSRPLTNGVVAGLLLGGLGYGTGALAETLFPERYLQRGKLRRSLAAAGGLAGAGLALNNAYAAGRAMNTDTLHGLITPNNAIPPYLQTAGEKKSYDFGPDPTMSNDTGLYAPSIPVQQFNQMAWNDVNKQYYNPNGMHTPPQYAAVTTGMLSGISAGTQSPIIRPIDVVRGFVSAGVGLATANLAGRTLSALAGLTPAAQNKLQDMGLWAGMMHAIVPPLFGGR